MKDLLTDELRLRGVLVTQSATVARAGAGLDTVLELEGQKMTVRQLAQLKQQAAVTTAAAVSPSEPASKKAKLHDSNETNEDQDVSKKMLKKSKVA